MQIPDLINGSLELIGCLSILNHVRALWKSKQAHGISVISTMFFFGWGLWNLFYYPHLDQWLSFAGGIAITIANCIWIASILYIRKTESVK